MKMNVKFSQVVRDNRSNGAGKHESGPGAGPEDVGKTPPGPEDPQGKEMLEEGDGSPRKPSKRPEELVKKNDNEKTEESPKGQKMSLAELKAGTSRRNIVLFAAMGALLMVALGVIAFLVLVPRAGGTPDKNSEPFPVETYFSRPDSLVGNTYEAVLKVDTQLAYEAGRGRLIAFQDPATGRLVPVFLPPPLADMNLDKGQTFVVRFQIKPKGVLHANHLRKQ